MRSRIMVSISSLALCALGAIPAAGSVIYGTNGSDIFRIDVDAVGMPTTLLMDGFAVFGGARDLAVGASANQLYFDDGSFTNPAYAHTLGSFNSKTALTSAMYGDFGSETGVTEGRDGYWYSHGSYLTSNPCVLIRTDPNSNAAPVLIGSAPASDNDYLIGDLATTPDQKLWGFTGDGRLVQVNKTTGLFDFVAGTMIEVSSGLPLMQVEALNGPLVGLASTLDGRLFISGTIGGNVYQLDLTNGQATFIGSAGFTYDLANETVPAPGVPLLVGVAALVAARRRRVRTTV